MKKGVKLTLVPGTRIVNLVRIQDMNIEVESAQLGVGRVRVLSIKGGEAGFLPGGIVGVKMPGSTSFWVMFGDGKVLEIRDASGQLISRNRYCCKECMTMTGQWVSDVQSPRSYGSREVMFRCSDCSHEWTLDV